MRSLRFDDPRLVTLTIMGLLAAFLWVAAWSVMGGTDFSIVELCRSALTGTPLPAEARENLAILAAVLPPEGITPRLIAETGVMWLLMMAAMMLPAMSAVIATYADIARIEHRGATLALRIGLFALSYFALWGVFALVAALMQLGVRGTAFFSHDGATAGPIAAGGLLLIAGAYQFTKLKEACLSKCRQPMAFLMAEWRPGIAGAARIGARHGLYCLGCCWALMGLMFVFGAMNLWWMAAIAVYCAAEKIAPRADVWGKHAGAAMIAGGVWMLASQI
ncbi:MAG: DUF2182 domain-containing protein [Pseudomonadota bacterium]